MSFVRAKKADLLFIYEPMVEHSTILDIGGCVGYSFSRLMSRVILIALVFGYVANRIFKL